MPRYKGVFQKRARKKSATPRDKKRIPVDESGGEKKKRRVAAGLEVENSNPPPAAPQLHPRRRASSSSSSSSLSSSSQEVSFLFVLFPPHVCVAGGMWFLVIALRALHFVWGFFLFPFSLVVLLFLYSVTPPSRRRSCAELFLREDVGCEVLDRKRRLPSFKQALHIQHPPTGTASARVSSRGTTVRCPFDFLFFFLLYLDFLRTHARRAAKGGMEWQGWSNCQDR